MASVPLHFVSSEDELQRMTVDLLQYSEIAIDLEVRKKIKTDRLLILIFRNQVNILMLALFA